MTLLTERPAPHGAPPANVTVAVTDRVGYVTIGHGLRRNALPPEGWVELEQAVAELSARDDVSLIVFRGAAGTFSAGSDLTLWDGATPEKVDADFAKIESALQAIERAPVPTLAVIDGVAAGGGCELALACDLRMMATSARIGMPILQLGILVSPSFALRMSALTGVARTRELLYTGRLVSGPEAGELGLAEIVVAEEELEATLAQWVATVSQQPRPGLLAAKKASAIALESLRSRHEAPQWRFTDHPEFQRRIHAFMTR